MWFENLSEEAEGGETGTAGHKELYIRFAEAAGIPRDELDAALPLPETRGLLNWRELLITQRSWLELYASQGLALEGTASGRMQRVVNGLCDHYGFERESDDILYWTLHMSVDEDHMKVGPYVIEKYAVSDLEQQSVREALNATLDRLLARLRRHHARLRPRGPPLRRVALRGAEASYAIRTLQPKGSSL